MKRALIVCVFVLGAFFMYACGGGGGGGEDVASNQAVSITGTVTVEDGVAVAFLDSASLPSKKGNQPATIIGALDIAYNYSFISPALAQNSDTQGTALVGATVMLVDSLGAVIATTTTDEVEIFNLLELLQAHIRFLLLTRELLP